MDAAPLSRDQLRNVYNFVFENIKEQARSHKMSFVRICLALAFLMPVIALGDAKPSTLHASGAWIREGPPNVTALAGYMVIENRGSKDRQLLGVSSPAFGHVELHRTRLEDGVARMIPQDSMPVPAGGRLELKPGEYHLMMMQPGQALKAGDRVEAVLRFDDEEELTASFLVKKAKGGDHYHHHH
jgi:copper(I)-binding protein